MEKQYIVLATSLTGLYGRQMKQGDIHPEGYFANLKDNVDNKSVEEYDAKKVYSFGAPAIVALTDLEKAQAKVDADTKAFDDAKGELVAAEEVKGLLTAEAKPATVKAADKAIEKAQAKVDAVGIALTESIAALDLLKA